MTFSDAYIKLKIIFHIPLPITRPFLQRQKNQHKERWFCKECLRSFNLVPWKTYRSQKMSEIACPYCNSKAIHWSDKLFRAQVDGKPYVRFIGHFK